MRFASSIAEERERYQRRRRRVRLCASIVATWGLAAAALVSTTATAGLNLHVPDIEFRRSTMIEPSRLTLTPPRLSPLRWWARNGWQPRMSRKPRASGSQPISARSISPARIAHKPCPDSRCSFSTTRCCYLARGSTRRSTSIARAVCSRPASPRSWADTGFGASGLTPSGPSRAALTLSRPDGTTPTVSRATALASVTPAPVEPEIIMVSTLRIPSIVPATQALLQQPTVALSLPNLDLTDPETRRREMRCLAEAVYFEARSEPETGQAAVAQVVINRAKSGSTPAPSAGSFTRTGIATKPASSLSLARARRW